MEPSQPPKRFVVVPERSAVLVRARSNVGPIVFATTDVTGEVETPFRDDGTLLAERATATVQVHVSRLASGNDLYDAELRRRVDARRYPKAELRLEHAAHLSDGDRYQVRGSITFHGSTRPLAGTVRVEVPAGESGGPRKLKVRGEHVVDIRDFDIAAPSMLMLKIFPDVRVELALEAEETEAAAGDAVPPAAG